MKCTFMIFIISRCGYKYQIILRKPPSLYPISQYKIRITTPLRHVHLYVSSLFICCSLYKEWTRLFDSVLQLLNHILIIKTKVLHLQALVILADFSYSVYTLWFSCSRSLLIYLAFKYFGFERIWWRLL